MKIDTSKISDKVKPKLNTTSTKLTTSRTKLSSITVPSDFSYTSYLNSIIDDLSSNKNKINSINDWLDDVIEKFDEAESKNESILDSIMNSLSDFIFGGSKTSSSSKGTGTASSSGGITSILSGIASSSTGTIDSVNGIFDASGSLINTRVEVATEYSSDFMNSDESFITDTSGSIVSGFTSLYSTVTGVIELGTTFINEGIETAKEYISVAAESIENFIENTASKAAEGFTSFVEQASNIADNVIQSICDFGVSVANGLKSAGAKFVETCSNVYSDYIAPALEVIWTQVCAVVADIGNVVASLLKGIYKLGESIVDTVLILGSGIGSIFTGIYDGVSYLYSLATGKTDDWNSATASMWSWTMSTVAIDVTAEASDMFYNTSVGQWLDSNAHQPFKSTGMVCQITEGIGYILGIIGLSIATAGVADIALGAEISTTAVSAGVATFSGFGKYTGEYWGNVKEAALEAGEECWTTLENGVKGILYGAVNGAWEGIQFYVGGELNQWAIEGNQLLTSSVRVGVDSIFNGTDTFFRTGIEALLTDENLSEAWENQGGWSSVISNLAIGFLMSAGGEAFELYNSGKISTDTEINTNAIEFESSSTQITSLDDAIKATLEKYGITPTTAAIEQYKNEIINGNYSRITRDYGARAFVENYELQADAVIKSFNDAMSTGNASNKVVLDFISEAFEKEIKNGNTEAMAILETITELKKANPKLTFELSNTSGSYWQWKKTGLFGGQTVVDNLCINANQINWNAPDVAYHEIGHLLYSLVSSEQLPTGIDGILGRARVYSTGTNADGSLAKYLNDTWNINNYRWSEARLDVQNTVMGWGYSSIDDYIAKESTKYGADGVNIVTNQVNDWISYIADKIERQNFAGYAAVDDIIDAVFLAEQEGVLGQNISTPYKHPKTYYDNSSNKTLSAFHEMIANFNQLKLEQNEPLLQAVKDIFGSEFYNTLENLYNSFKK